MTLKEVLADRTKYQDNLVWKFDESTSLTLGQLRAMSEERQDSLTKAEKEAEKRAQIAEAKEKELQAAQLKTAEVYTDLMAAVEAMKAGRINDPALTRFAGVAHNNNDPFADLSRLETDTLLGPVVKVLRHVSDEAKKAQEAVAANAKIQQNMAMSYLNGVLEDRYDRLVPFDKQEKLPLKQLIETAVANKYTATDGSPDIKKAYRDLTSGDTLQAKLDQARADERKKVEAELAEKYQGINVPSPQGGNIFGLDVNNRSGAAPKAFANLDEAFKAAAADKEIWAQVDQITH